MYRTGHGSKTAGRSWRDVTQVERVAHTRDVDTDTGTDIGSGIDIGTDMVVVGVDVGGGGEGTGLGLVGCAMALLFRREGVRWRTMTRRRTCLSVLGRGCASWC